MQKRRSLFAVILVGILVWSGCRATNLSATEKALIPMSNAEIRQLQHDLLTYKYIYSNIWPYNLDDLLDYHRKAGRTNVTYSNFEQLSWKQDHDSLKVSYTYLYPDQVESDFDKVKGGITLYTTSDSTAYVSHDLNRVKKRKPSR